MFNRKARIDRVKQQLSRQVADLQAELEAKNRIIAILETERESLGAVIVRDRERVLSETAAYVRARAEAEGHHEPTLSR